MNLTGQQIKIFTNPFPGGWTPQDIDTFLGGSEEAVVYLAQTLVEKGAVVTVYHDKNSNCYLFRGVNYKNREEAECNADDIFITFKDKTPWLNRADAKIKIHWSCETEKIWDYKAVDAVVHLSEFHKSRHPWIFASHSNVIPLGIDTDSLTRNKTAKEPGSILYCSSPDRGLQHLIQDWSTIKKHYPNLVLKVAYGFSHIDKFSQNHTVNQFKEDTLKALDQPGIDYLGTLDKDEIEKEYWKAQFWCLPLIHPESELFCLNAVKSRFCGCTPVVNRIGALTNTVGVHFKYSDFISGCAGLIETKKEPVSFLTWSSVVDDYWDPLFDTILSKKGQL